MGRFSLGAASVAVALILALSAGCARTPATLPSVVSTSEIASAAPTLADNPGSASLSNASQVATPAGIETATITIGWVGDTTPGSRYGMPPKHGRALFSAVRSYLRAPDIMIGNLEGTFGSGGPSKSGSSGTSYSFQAPMANAESLSWAGFDAMSIANNHAHDYLAAGMASTRKALTHNGLAYTGLPRQITVITRKGVRVALIGAAPYSWNQSLADVSGTAALVRKARRRADVVVVVMHAGAEGADKTHTPRGAETAYGEFRGDPRRFSHAMIDAGASLVLGSGPHVIRGIERYHDRLIAYSLGNFAGWGNFDTSGVLGLSGILTVTVDGKGDVLGGRWRALRLVGQGVPKSDGSHASLSLVRRLSAADFAHTFRLRSNGSFGTTE